MLNIIPLAKEDYENNIVYTVLYPMKIQYLSKELLDVLYFKMCTEI